MFDPKSCEQHTERYMIGESSFEKSGRNCHSRLLTIAHGCSRLLTISHIFISLYSCYICRRRSLGVPRALLFRSTFYMLTIAHDCSRLLTIAHDCSRFLCVHCLHLPSFFDPVPAHEHVSSSANRWQNYIAIYWQVRINLTTSGSLTKAPL